MDWRNSLLAGTFFVSSLVGGCASSDNVAMYGDYSINLSESERYGTVDVRAKLTPLSFSTEYTSIVAYDLGKDNTVDKICVTKRGREGEQTLLYDSEGKLRMCFGGSFVTEKEEVRRLRKIGESVLGIVPAGQEEESKGLFSFLR